MSQFFTRARFGRPQLFAALLLLAFLGQAGWLVYAEIGSVQNLDGSEASRIGEGWKQWHGRGIAAAPYIESQGGSAFDPFLSDPSGFDTQRSPLVYLATVAPLLAWPRDLGPDTAPYWRWLVKLPFLGCGLFLGASLWYVARRLCGNTGGLVALTFYCFSPLFIQASAVWHTEPEIVGAWGAFGTIFTAIAVAHTLYAPREVVLWNWRRIVLLGISMAIAIGSQFSLIVVVPMALAFLLYVAPVRRGAAVVIWLAACAVAAILLFGIYFFHPHSFLESMRHASFWGVTWQGFAVPGVYKQVAIQISRACPALALVFPVCLVTYGVWRRTRYFGNTAPLLVALIFIGLGMAHPNIAAPGFLLASVPFLFIFVSGVLADLMETSYRQVILACVVALLITYVARTLMALAQVVRG